jgi:spoIIIJ-associated protein
MTIREYVDEVIGFLTISPENVEVEETEEFVFVRLQVTEDDVGKMIGRHGETLTGLSHLMMVTFREQLNGLRVIVDVNAYKEQREDEAVEEAKEAFEQVLETGKPYHMPQSLLAHQRLAVHQALQEIAGVFTQSEGEGEYRHLVIHPVSEHEALQEK